MVYLAVLIPSLYHKIMAKKLIDWDINYANSEEKNIALIQNKNSGIKLLTNNKSIIV